MCDWARSPSFDDNSSDVRVTAASGPPRVIAVSLGGAMSSCEQLQQGSLFDHLVRTGKECRRNGEAEHLRRLEVDSQLDLRGLEAKVVHRQLQANHFANAGAP